MCIDHCLTCCSTCCSLYLFYLIWWIKGVHPLPRWHEVARTLCHFGSRSIQTGQFDLGPGQFPLAPRSHPPVRAMSRNSQRGYDQGRRGQGGQGGRGWTPAYSSGDYGAGSNAHNPYEVQMPRFLEAITDATHAEDQSIIVVDKRDDRIVSPFQSWLVSEIMSNAASSINVMTERDQVMPPNSGFHVALFGNYHLGWYQGGDRHLDREQHWQSLRWVGREHSSCQQSHRLEVLENFCAWHVAHGVTHFRAHSDQDHHFGPWEQSQSRRSGTDRAVRSAGSHPWRLVVKLRCRGWEPGRQLGHLCGGPGSGQFPPSIQVEAVGEGVWDRPQCSSRRNAACHINTSSIRASSSDSGRMAIWSGWDDGRSKQFTWWGHFGLREQADGAWARRAIAPGSTYQPRRRRPCCQRWSWSCQDGSKVCKVHILAHTSDLRRDDGQSCVQHFHGHDRGGGAWTQGGGGSSVEGAWQHPRARVHSAGWDGSEHHSELYTGGIEASDAGISSWEAIWRLGAHRSCGGLQKRWELCSTAADLLLSIDL